MWIAIRPFNYRGQKYQVGDQVDPTGWPIRKMLIARRRIREVPASAENVTKPTLKAMTRAELNSLATQMGIVDAADYPNRDALIARITSDDKEGNVDPVEPTKEKASKDSKSEDPETEEPEEESEESEEEDSEEDVPDDDADEDDE